MENRAKSVLEKKREEKESEIKAYNEKVANLNVEINLINELLKDIEHPSNGSINKGEGVSDIGSVKEREKEVINLFRKIGTTLRTPDFETSFTNEFGHYKNMTNILRKMRNKGKIASVKYEGQMQLVYHGLPEWIESNDFKDNYKKNSNSDAKRVN